MPSRKPLFSFSPLLSLKKKNPILSNSIAVGQHARKDYFTTLLPRNMWAEIWLEETSLCF